jgi:hypothetical protein
MQIDTSKRPWRLLARAATVLKQIYGKMPERDKLIITGNSQP